MAGYARAMTHVALDVENPFAARSTLPYELPPFADIRIEHYLPAIEAGMAEHLDEVNAIIGSVETPSFVNTIEALERSGQLLNRAVTVFYNQHSSDTSDALDALAEIIAPKLSAHGDAIVLNPALFARIDSLYARRDELGLPAQDRWLLEQYHRDFVHAGAALDAAQRQRLTEINEELSTLETQFGKQLLADTNDSALLFDAAADLAGLDEETLGAAATAAAARGFDGQWLIGQVNYTGHPLLESLTNRATRERIMKASLAKGARANDNDTRATLLQMVALRAERAGLFGDDTHAAHVIAQQTAGSPERVHEMLRRIAPAAAANARREADMLLEAARADGLQEIAAWDWDFYSERVRRERFNVDTAAMRPYFELERVLRDGVFHAAQQLFGITFTERPDLVAHHPEARVFEVHNEDGSPLGLYIGDFYTRDSKRGGAWMNNLVDQNHLLGQLPVVVNNLNVPKPGAGAPTLLTFDETSTLFHEFGHALHGLLSDVRYARVSGTNVQRDFVEFPSQVNEMWMLWPEVVANYAKHHETGEPLPQEWIDNVNASITFNQGHATTSYLAAAVLDLAWHEVAPDAAIEDVEAFEAAAIAAYGLDFAPVPTRYRSTYFAHIFAGGYSAGYYGYIWSEVLDADTVQWFKENGGLTRANGDHFRRTLLSRGASIDALEMFRTFRGRDAVIEPLLTRRGLLAADV